MAVKTKAQLLSDLASTLTDGGELTASEDRGLRTDYIDSFLTNLTFDYVAFVSASGSDTTGTVGRLDLPFRTIGAAITASASGGLVKYIGSSLDISNNVTITTKDGVDIDFGNLRYSGQINCVGACNIFSSHSLTNNSGNIFSATSACNVYVYAKTVVGNISITNASASLTIEAVTMGATTGSWIGATNGNIVVKNATVTFSGGVSAAITPTAGTGLLKFINCTISSATTEVIAMSTTSTYVITLMRCVLSTAGTNKSCIKSSVGSGSTPSFNIDRSILIATGSGYSVESTTVNTDVVVYGTVLSNKSISSNVTEAIGTLYADAAVEAI